MARHRLRSEGRRAAPRSLPVTSTSLIGREGDIAEVAELLQSPEVRLVTLTGPGGIGKTRLAIAVGERLDDRYPKGTAFVPLAAIDAPELVLPRIAAAVGAPMEGARPAAGRPDRPLRGRRRPCSCSTTWNRSWASRPRLISSWLAARASRSWRRAAPSFASGRNASTRSTRSPCPRSREPPPTDELASLPAVQLFVDRAQAVRHDFALTEDNAGAIVEICRRRRRSPPRHRAGGRPHPAAAASCAARAAGTKPRRLGHRLGRPPRTAANAACDRRMELRAARRSRATDAGHACRSSSTGGRSRRPMDVADLTEDRTLDLLDALAGHSLVIVDAVDPEPRFHMLAAVREFAARAPRRRRRPRRRREAARGPLRRFRGERRLARGRTSRVGRAPAGGRGEPSGRDPLVPRARHRTTPAHVPHPVAVLADAGRMPEGRAWIDEVQHQSRRLGRPRSSRAAVHLRRHGRRGRR